MDYAVVGPFSESKMITLKGVSFALGVALAATAAWAQDPPVASVPAWNATNGLSPGGLRPCIASPLGHERNEWEDVRTPSCVAGTAWAQDPQGTIVTVTVAPGIQLSRTIPGAVELSPDQKLATAYALCAISALDALLQTAINEILHSAPLGEETTPDCRAVMVAYERGHDHQSDADRAFIEEVARSLK